MVPPLRGEGEREREREREEEGEERNEEQRGETRAENASERGRRVHVGWSAGPALRVQLVNK